MLQQKLYHDDSLRNYHNECNKIITVSKLLTLVTKNIGPVTMIFFINSKLEK